VCPPSTDVPELPLLELELPDLPDFPLELPPDLPDLLPPDFPLFPLELLVEDSSSSSGSGLGADHPSSVPQPSSAQGSSSCRDSLALNDFPSTVAAAANAMVSCMYETFIVDY